MHSKNYYIRVVLFSSIFFIIKYKKNEKLLLRVHIILLECLNLQQVLIRK